MKNKINLSKNCLNCGLIYSKPDNWSNSTWSKNLYHSRKCAVEGARVQGKYIRTPEYRKQISERQQGEKNHGWKGDNVSYKPLHEWVRNHLAKPQVCRDCNQPKPLDLANISQEYKRDLSDWEWLCRSCHMTKDGRLERLQHNKKISRDQQALKEQKGING